MSRSVTVTSSSSRAASTVPALERAYSGSATTVRSGMAYTRRVSTSQWTEAAVKAVDRAFFEVVESAQWEFEVGFGIGALGALAKVRDDEVPARCRMDLLVARNATRRSEELLRAIARLFASSQLPDRVQAPNEYQLDDEDEPGDILAIIDAHAAAGTLFNEDVPPASTAEPSESPSKRSTVTNITISSVHIGELRAFAEATGQVELMAECDQALGPPMDPLVWALDLRRRLAALYNAFLVHHMSPLGHWTGHAWRQVGLASGQLLVFPDLPPPVNKMDVSDLLAEAQARLRDVHAHDVPHDAQADLHKVKTAKSYDLALLRAMSRLYSYSLEWRLDRVKAELGREPREDRRDAN